MALIMMGAVLGASRRFQSESDDSCDCPQDEDIYWKIAKNKESIAKFKHNKQTAMRNIMKARTGR